MISDKLIIQTIQRLSILLETLSQSTLVISSVDIIIEVYVKLTHVIGKVVLGERVVKSSVLELGASSLLVIMKPHHMLG